MHMFVTAESSGEHTNGQGMEGGHANFLFSLGKEPRQGWTIPDQQASRSSSAQKAELVSTNFSVPVEEQARPRTSYGLGDAGASLYTLSFTTPRERGDLDVNRASSQSPKQSNVLSSSSHRLYSRFAGCDRSSVWSSLQVFHAQHVLGSCSHSSSG